MAQTGITIGEVLKPSEQISRPLPPPGTSMLGTDLFPIAPAGQLSYEAQTLQAQKIAIMLMVEELRANVDGKVKVEGIPTSIPDLPPRGTSVIGTALFPIGQSSDMGPEAQLAQEWHIEMVRTLDDLRAQRSSEAQVEATHSASTNEPEVDKGIGEAKSADGEKDVVDDSGKCDGSD